ncbi:MAG: acyloxyacyl hydrolase [Burkholderiales bacterium]
MLSTFWPRWTALATGVVLAAAGMQAMAVDGVSVTGGGGGDASIARVGIQWDWNKRWFATGDWHINGYWDLTLAQWFAHSSYQANDITNLGFTPVFRFEQSDQRGLYFDIGVGVNLISRTSLNYYKHYSTAFQFGDQAGLGYRFGGRGEHDLQLQVQHLSNASIKQPNNGINFFMLRYEYRF